LTFSDGSGRQDAAPTDTTMTHIVGAAPCRPSLANVIYPVILGLSRNPKMINQGTWILGQAQNDKI
ncbi:MAG: hypothetical protein LBL26_06775, partial [Peptococcaceae bacterium]|nr:hypothetical protein [Peptococcaceae bacterium]